MARTLGFRTYPLGDISHARQGKGALSPATKIKILDTLGYMASRDLLIDLLPKKTADKIWKYDNLRFLKRGEK